MKEVIYFFIIYFLSFGLLGQSPIFREVPLSINDEFNSFHIDSLGFLWAASDKAIYKYDGFNIDIHFQTEEEIVIKGFDEDRNGNFIFSTSNGELFELNPFNYNYRLLSSDERKPVTYIQCDDFDLKCLLVSYGNGVRLKFGKIDTFLTTDNMLPSNEVYEALFLDGEIWLATDQGLQKIRVIGEKLESRIYNKNDGFSDVVFTNLEDQQKDLWISTFNQSIEKLLLSSKVEKHTLSQISRVNDLVVDKNAVFVCTTSGLYTLLGDSLVQIYPEEGESFVNTMIADEEGNIWISDKEHHLVLGERLFQRLDPKINNIQAISYFNNNLIVGSDQGLFLKSGPGYDQLLDANITAIEHNDEPYLWVGTFSKGVFIFNDHYEMIAHISEWDGFPGQSILSIEPYEKGALVSSLTGLKGFSIDKNDQQTIITTNEDYDKIEKEGYVYQSLFLDEKIYFATDRQGLKIYDGGEVKTLDINEKGSKIGSVYSMAIDRKRRIWLSTSEEGLVYVNSDSTIHNIDHKVSNDEYTSIITLKDSTFLLIRAGSVDWYDPDSGNFLFFDNELGIANEAAYLNNYTVRGSNIYFVHDQFIYDFNYEFIQKKSPSVLLEKVLVNLVEVKDETIFHQEENNVQFNFIGSWLSDPSKLTYRYKLEGFDTEWRETGDRVVAYPKLEPGTYNFSVIAGIEGSYSGDPALASFKFEIKRYFYNTLWFWGLLILLLFSLVSYLISLRRKQQLQNAEIKQKHVESQLESLKSQLNPHFLFNSFNTLIGLIEEDQKDSSLSFVENLTDFYRLILEHGKQKLVPFDEEIKLVKLFVDLLNERFHGGIILKTPDKTCHSLVPPLTLQLLVENAVKHNEVGNSGGLEITFSIKNQYISIKNNRKPKQYPVKSSGSGLSNIKKRYLLLNTKSVKVKETEQYFEVLLPFIFAKDQLKSS